MAERRPAMDQHMAKAYVHPLRAEALSLIAEGVASPKQIARKLGAEVSNVAYHVRVLRELGCIELTETRQKRGAIEHLYRVTDQAPKSRL